MKSDQTTGSLNRPSRVLLAAGWFGVLTGLIEALYQVVYRQYFRNHPINQTRDILWMAPLADLVFFMVLGGILALGVWRWQRWISTQVVVLALAFLSFISLLLLFPALHSWAVLLLALGLAVQTSRMIARYSQGFYSIVRRTIVVLCLVVVVLGLGLHGWQNWSERRAVAKLPPARPGAPNVILITLDTVRASSLSAYGYGRPTSPELERWAKRGVLFEQAIATAPWTLPSHASMFTGRFPHEMTFSQLDPLRTSHPTVAEVLSEQGYESAGFVANFFYCQRGQGLDVGMIHYSDYPVTAGQVLLSSALGRVIDKSGWVGRITGYYDYLNDKNAEMLNDEFLSWLSVRDNKRPFFVFLNYFDPHFPYLASAPFDQKFGPNKPNSTSFHADLDTREEKLATLAPAVLEVERRLYDGSIAYLDHQLGLLFSELEKRGALANTLVVITSDHGEQFGEHGLYNHGNSLYLPLLRVPLMIIGPRVPAGVSVPQAVSLRDIPATIMDLVGPNQATRFPGDTLMRYVNGTGSGSVSTTVVPVFSELEWTDPKTGHLRAPMTSMVTDRYHYVRYADGVDELFDLTKDPEEKQNVADAAESRSALESFRSNFKTLNKVAQK